MSAAIAALPMYDWPEARAETDAEWARLRARLAAADVAAPERLVRRNAEMPAVPGGIRDAGGAVVAPDPSTLPAEALDFNALWLHPRLLLAQTCWGPLELGLGAHVTVVGQPSYDAFPGGSGPLYSSAVLMRRGAADAVAPPQDGRAVLPLDRFAGARLAFNAPDSMSGAIALTRDLEALGRGLDLFGERIATGSHRASIAAVAGGAADFCAIDCRSWALALHHEPAARDLVVAGWTARRKGLPYVTSRHTPAALVARLRGALAGG